MIGYKATDKNMCASLGDGMQFELNHTYHIDDNDITQNGFHFCKELGLIGLYYNFKDCRIFEVEANGNIESKDDMVYSTDTITFVRELSKDDINNVFKKLLTVLIEGQKLYPLNPFVLGCRYGLSACLDSEDDEVRYMLCDLGYGLDILAHDKNDKISTLAKSKLKKIV